MNSVVLATNRKALYSYAIKDKFESGIVLEGWEVKAIRKGKMNIGGAFVTQLGNELYLINASITPCIQDPHIKYQERKNRKLLLHRKEINRILGVIKSSGCSAIALKVYTSARDKIKLEIATVQGKTKIDKRHTIKEREWHREKAKMLKTKGNL